MWVKRSIMTLSLDVKESIHTEPTINSSETYPTKSPIMFYFDVSWNNPDLDETCSSYLDKYFSHYAVGREVSESGIEHYQVIAWEHKNGYQNLIATLKREFNLKGRAYKGSRKQYGRKRNKIEDIEKCIAYSIKPGKGYGEYFSKGFDKQYISWIHDEISFEKELNPKQKKDILRKELKKKLDHYIGEFNHQYYRDPLLSEKVEYLGEQHVIEHYKIFATLPSERQKMILYYELGIVTASLYNKFTNNRLFNYLEHTEKTVWNDFKYN